MQSLRFRAQKEGAPSEMHKGRLQKQEPLVQRSQEIFLQEMALPLGNRTFSSHQVQQERVEGQVPINGRKEMLEGQGRLQNVQKKQIHAKKPEAKLDLKLVQRPRTPLQETIGARRVMLISNVPVNSCASIKPESTWP